MYAIWKHIEKSLREKAAAETYAPTHPGRPLPRTADGSCPLGVALNWNNEEIWKAPGPFLVARACSAPASQAGRFIRDWDNGKIKDLRRAMGLSVR